MANLVNQPSFAAGEIGPELYGRVDQELYYIGLRTCRNFIVRQYGGVSNRPGSYFICEYKDSANYGRLIQFQFNEIQTYCLELGHQYMRVIKDGGEVLETAATKNITGITQANPGVLTSAAHGFSNGEDVYVSGISGMTQLNGRSLRVANATANTFTLKDYQGVGINTTSYGAYASGGTAARIYTVTTPWRAADLFNLNYAQSADVLTVVHKNYPIKDITRTAHDAWTVTDFNPSNGPFKDVNVTSTTVQPSASSGSGITLTASSGIFSSSDVGSLMYIEQMPTDTTQTWEVGKAIALNAIYRAGYHYYQAKNAATTGTVKPDWTEGTQTDGASGVQWQYLHSGFGIVKITAYTNSTHVTADVIKRLPDNAVSTATTNWAKAAWSPIEGYPSAVAYHKQRLWFGATINSPNGLWCSNVGARLAFGTSKPLLDDEAISVSLDTTQVNAVRHLISLSSLIVLTSSSEHLVSGNTDGSILATSPPQPKVQGYNGSRYVHPIIIGNTALYVEDTGDVVRSLQYDLQTDSFTGIDLCARSPHLFRGKQIVDWGYQKRPLAVIWTVLNDGSLLGFTYMQEQKVYAWHRHDTDGTYESICCIRESATSSETSAYKLVRRLVNGTYRRYVERDASRYFSDIVDAYFVDCGLTYDGRNTSATTITVTGGTTWDTPEVLTLTASSAIFKSTDIGDQITFVQPEDISAGTPEITYRLTISGYTSSTVVSAVPAKALPAAYQAVARSDWSFARTKFGPFHHLEGKSVVALSDGNVVEGMIVTNGIVTIDHPGSVVHAGLRYVGEIETLDFAQPQGQGKSKTLNIPQLWITAQESRALFVATNAYGDTSKNATTDIKERLRKDKFVEIKQRTAAIGYDAAIPAQTDVFEVNTNTSWSKRGRICLRQPYPLPITINCITEEAPLGMS